jgi:hypothetical protein
MRHVSALLCSIFLAASLTATTVHAANSVNISSSTCTGTEVRDLTGDAIFTCSGDYSFLSGSIEWDTNISITASGNLYFDDFTIKGMQVQLRSLNGLISIEGRALIDSGALGNWPGPIPTPPGGVLVGGSGVITVVPEPEIHAMLLAGLGLLWGIARRRQDGVRSA